MPLNVTLLTAYKDNYIFVFQTHDNRTVIVDPGDAKPVIEYLEENNLRADVILLTHHHWDHTNGVKELVKKYGCAVWGPSTETKRIPSMTKLLEDNQEYSLDNFAFEVFHTAGHTHGHICLYFKQEKTLFCGDTLFSLGCGRVFEGTMAQMHESLQRLAKLPDDTRVFCAHEYTVANAQFAMTVTDKSEELKDVLTELEKKRTNKKPTVPSTMGFEKAYNPFLNAKSVDEFKELRTTKDNF